MWGRGAEPVPAVIRREVCLIIITDSYCYLRKQCESSHISVFHMRIPMCTQMQKLWWTHALCISSYGSKTIWQNSEFTSKALFQLARCFIRWEINQRNTNTQIIWQCEMWMFHIVYHKPSVWTLSKLNTTQSFLPSVLFPSFVYAPWEHTVSTIC